MLRVNNGWIDGSMDDFFLNSTFITELKYFTYISRISGALRVQQDFRLSHQHGESKLPAFLGCTNLSSYIIMNWLDILSHNHLALTSRPSRSFCIPAMNHKRVRSCCLRAVSSLCRYVRLLSCLLYTVDKKVRLQKNKNSIVSRTRHRAPS